MKIGGVTVQNATLHNAEYIESNDIRVGDTVFVVRAGDVIPRVVGPVLSERKGDPPKFRMPDTCPVCGADVDHPEGEAMSRCTNAVCPAQLFERVRHFCFARRDGHRGHRRRDGASSSPRSAWCGTSRDVYDLSKEQLSTVPAHRRENDCESAAQHRSVEIARPSAAADGTRHSVRRHANGADSGGRLRIDRCDRGGGARSSCTQSEGIGPEVAASVRLFFQQQANRDVIERLRAAGVQMTAPNAREQRLEHSRVRRSC